MDDDPTTVPLDRLDRLWNFDDPAGSEQRFRALLPRARAERGGALLAELLTQLARARVAGPVRGGQRALHEAALSLRPDDDAAASGSSSSAAGLRTARAGAAAAPPVRRRVGARPRGGRGHARGGCRAHARHRRAARERLGLEREGDAARADVAGPARPPLGRVACEQHGLGAARSRRLRRGAFALPGRPRGAEAEGTANQVRSRAGAWPAACAPWAG